MTKPKTTKIRWIGPTRFIPDLGITVDAGDLFTLPASLALGGEGTLWEKATKKATAKTTTTKEK